MARRYPMIPRKKSSSTSDRTTLLKRESGRINGTGSQLQACHGRKLMIPLKAIRCGFVFVLAFSVLILFSTSSVSFGAPPNPGQAADSSKTWVAPDPATIPSGPLGDSIRLGLHIFNETPKYAERYVGNKMSCAHCHINGGTVSKGMPMVGLPGIFPMYRDREKT